MSSASPLYLSEPTSVATLSGGATAAITVALRRTQIGCQSRKPVELVSSEVDGDVAAVLSR
jgi:hypothetical protein